MTLRMAVITIKSRAYWWVCGAMVTVLLSACGGGGPGDNPPPQREVPALVWQLPQARVDGTPLDVAEIAEVEIWYQQESDEQPKLLASVSSDINSYVPDELPAGRYQFHLVAVDFSWLRSEPSATRELLLP